MYKIKDIHLETYRTTNGGMYTIVCVYQRMHNINILFIYPYIDIHEWCSKPATRPVGEIMQMPSIQKNRFQA